MTPLTENINFVLAPPTPVGVSNLHFAVTGGRGHCHNNMKEIPLKHGGVAKVDDSDYDILIKYKWRRSLEGRCYYVYGQVDGIRVVMHRYILNITDRKVFIDHKDGDGLNNQRDNLRIATYSENSSNKRSRLGSTSKYLGVYFYTAKKKWFAQVRKNGVIVFKKRFNTELEAALAYNEAAAEIHGEFANLNKIDINELQG